MTPSNIEGWDLKPIYKDRLYRYRRTIGQNELTIDIRVNGSQNDLWGRIEDNQNPMENNIDITYYRESAKWESRVHYVRAKYMGAIKPGPLINQNLCTGEDLAKFLVNLANEIVSTGWEIVLSKPAFEFPTNMV
jgi:hypothetical protein